MDLTVHIPDKIKLPPGEIRHLRDFLQRFGNRVAVGHIRYGAAKKEKKYKSRLGEEFRVYKRKYGGNMEQLLNIAVYSWLESYAPEHPNFHFDNKIDSVTRSKFK